MALQKRSVWLDPKAAEYLARRAKPPRARRHVTALRGKLAKLVDGVDIRRSDLESAQRAVGRGLRAGSGRAINCGLSTLVSDYVASDAIPQA